MTYPKCRLRKFSNKVIKYQGHTFDSILECTVYQMLRLLEMKKELKILELQPKVYMTEAEILLKPDFKCQRLGVKSEDIFYVEAKGFETSGWRLKRRLWIAYGPAVMEVYKKNKRGIYLHETITPIR